MRTLVLDSALTRRTAAVVVEDAVVAFRTATNKQGHDPILPVMALDVLNEAGVLEGGRNLGVIGRSRGENDLDLIAVTVGPGSFTGIRAGLALAHGIGLALSVPVIGVTVGEAIADSFPHLGYRTLWVVTDSHRGHIFLERGGEIGSFAQDVLPAPAHGVAVAGTAALHIAARLAAGGANVMLTDARFPLARHIAHVAARRLAGTLPPREALPVYVDPPEARLPAGGLRPPPEAAAR